MSDSLHRNRRRYGRSAASQAKRYKPTAMKHRTLRARRATDTVRSAPAVSATDQQWNTAFVHSQDMLAQLASEALADFKAGRTEPLDPERL